MKKPEVIPEISKGLMPQASKVGTRLSQEEGARKIQEMYDRDHEMVTGTFVNIENRSNGAGLGIGLLQFGFKKYKQDTYDFYELIDGERYTLPYMVAQHINENCFNLKYQNLPGEYGNNDVAQASNPQGRMLFNRPQMAKKMHRFSFNPLDFHQAQEFRRVDIAEVSLY